MAMTTNAKITGTTGDDIASQRKTVSPERELLVIAFHYPPDNSSTGVLRTLKFTQYLYRHSWRSCVISAPVSFYRFTDPESLRLVPPETAVYRTSALDIKQHVSLFGVYPSFLSYPDRYWPWVFPAARQAARLIRETRVDALYTTSPIPSAHLIGLRLKRRFGLPWLADFRDPWVEDSMPMLEKRVARYFERKVVTQADRVICNTPALRRTFLARYPELPPEKFVTIPNGYDEADFVGITPRRDAKFEILYPGPADNVNRNPRPLLEAVALALKNGWLPRENLQITFLGAGDSLRKTGCADDIERLALRDVIREEPRVPYREALARQAQADVLLVLNEPLGSGPGIEASRSWTQLCVPAKVYENLRLGRPSLALVSGGAVAELLETTGGGHVVAPHDIEAIARRLKELYEQHPAATTPPEISPVIAQYSRENLTRQLAAELDTLAR